MICCIKLREKRFFDENTFLWPSSVVVRKALDFRCTPRGAGVGFALGSALVGEFCWFDSHMCVVRFSVSMMTR